MTERWKPGTGYTKLLAILLSIAIIPCLLISALAYEVSIQNARKQAVTYSEQYLRLIANSHSAMLEQAQSIVYELMLNFDNYSDILRNRPMSADAHNLIQTLEKKSLASDSYFKGFYFVDNRARMLYTSASSSIYSFEDYPDPSFIDLLEKPSSALRLNDLFSRKESNGTKVASYVVRYPLTGNALGYLVVDLDLASFASLGANDSGKGGHLLIRNRHGELVNTDQQAAFDRVQERPGDYVIIRDRSDEAGLSYEYAIPRSRITADNRVLLLSIVTICAILVLLEVIAAWFSSKSLYTPLRNLLLYIRQLVGEQEPPAEEGKEQGDEYFYLRRVITRINMQNTDYAKALQANSQLFKQRQLSRLLLGQTSYIRKMEVPEKLRLHFPHPHFTVMVMEAGGRDEFRDKWTGLEQELMLYSVTNIAEEVLKERGEAVSAAFDSHRVVALLNHESVQGEGTIEEWARQLQEQVHHYLKLTLSIGIGPASGSAEGIPRSYEQAQRALSFKVYYGKGSILSAGKLSETPATGRKPISWAEVRERLKVRLQAADWEPTRETVASLAAESAYAGMTENDLRLFYLQYTACLSDLCAEFAVPFHELAGGDDAPDLSGNGMATFDELTAAMMTLTFRLHERIQSTKDHVHQELIQNILHYISEHLDQDLTLESIAEKVYMHPAYLSRVCKALTGKGLGEQIVQARIDRAKELLTGTNVSVNEISTRIGYTNPRAFYRLFKEYTGLTPGKYRKREGLKNVK